jgi:hypothetical protein
LSSNGSVLVGGEIRRVAILTVRDEPCACYLARQLADSGVELLFLSQQRLKIEPGTVPYYRRLFRRRGLANALDNLLLDAAKSGVRRLARLVPAVRRVSAGHGSAAAGVVSAPLAPALRPDPALPTESWLRYERIEDINGRADRERLVSFEPDLLLLGGAPVLGRRVIRVPTVACLNAHCGITPLYAGSTPFDRAILESHFEDIGYTIHLVVPKVDGGPVLEQVRVAWDPRKPNGALWPMLAQAMYDRLAALSRRLIAGEVLEARRQSDVRVQPPAGLFVRLRAERNRRRYARRWHPPD